MSEINDASKYFDANWRKYQDSISCNTLYHKEMGAELRHFLIQHFNASYTLVDVGCGDSSTIIPVISATKIEKYIGVDAAPNVLKIADSNLAALNCKKEFICGNMSDAVTQFPENIDIIYTSYALHHLSCDNKIEFIRNCKNKLKQGGFLIIVDGVLSTNQTRDEWLDALKNRMQETQHMSAEELEFRMEHPRADDFPESIATYQKIAEDQKWKKFEVLIDKEIFAFMVFGK
ncbi:MAG TPA: class I SAM-dependent methyltransferase [Gammaproteobacteria bacterium]|jgi:SAM-dependent methyltransferase|nr:class I SAM-dependent methyltransferase [Gammaproteobacteria bacterium]